MQEALRAIVKRLPELAACRSTRELEAHPVYRAIEPGLRQVMDTPQTGDFTGGAAPSRDRYRVLAWNIERGSRFDEQVGAFRTHEYLKDCDVLLLSETDVGMARSGNRDVARDLAQELGMHYAFAPCYLSLVKGSGAERHVEGENDLGLHGNAILSRYPIMSPRIVRLKNGIDKMASREQRIGSQATLVAEINFPGWMVQAACVHLDANSTQRHRARQMRDVLDVLPATGPVVVGGDWNTTTFDSSTATRAIMGYFRRVLMGPGNVIRNHYAHPYRHFERELFALIETRGFDWRNANQTGEHTIYYDFANERTFQGLAEWVPLWCFPFIRWALRDHGGGCPLKIDWFAVRGVRPMNPVVIHDVREGRAVPLSDHDAIGLEIAP